MTSIAAESKGPEKVERVTLKGTEYKALADGQYDVIILGTGFKECLLAGLLAAVGKKKVLQLDRNDYYGAACGTLQLDQMHERNGQEFNAEAMKKQFGRWRSFLLDLIPKFILASGKLVKMLIQTGVTRYVEFAAVDSSFVYTSGKIYKVPVTPSEALRTSLVGLFQKRHLRSFAMFMNEYESQGPQKATPTERLARSGIQNITAAVTAFYERHNPQKVGDVEGILQKYEPQQLFTLLESQYGVPVASTEYDVVFGPGSLGLQINGEAVGKQGKSVTKVIGFNDLPEDSKNREAQLSCTVGDMVSKVNGQDALWMGYNDLLNLIRGGRDEQGNITITFMRALRNPGAESKSSAGASRIAGKTMAQVFSDYSLDANSQCFIGHAMALHTDDSYLQRPAIETIEAVKTYGMSVGRYGDSPYIYPLYGLSNIPEGFARLSAVYGGTIMLRTQLNELVFDEETGNIQGVIATFDEGMGEGPETLAATAPVVVGDPSYFQGTERVRKTGTIIRSTCVLQHSIKRTSDATSAQIIMPAKHLKSKSNDIFISVLSDRHSVAPAGSLLAIVSTKCETADPRSEVNEGLAVIGDVAMRFDDIVDTFEPVNDGTADNVFVTRSYDATSHFEFESREVLDLYAKIMGEELDLSMSIEELAKQQQAM